jgi:hypothetical protein
MSPQNRLNRLDQPTRLILQALDELGAGPGQQFRRSVFVLRRAMQLAGLPTAEHELALTDDAVDRSPNVALFHDALVRLVHGVGTEERLVEGGGNFGMTYGDPADPPAYPNFTACRLTSAGDELVRITP